jgi:acetyl esterase
MPLDPQFKMMLEQMATMGAPPLSAETPEQARQQFDAMLIAGKNPEPVSRTEDRSVPGPAGQLPVRVYTPEGPGPFPALVFFHGGGWVLGGIESHDDLCRVLTNRAGCITVSVDYRLAPEHKFPAAAEDAFAATRWVAENAGAVGADPARIAVAGDSAGGNLSAVVAQMAHDRGGPKLAHQVLIYPAIDAAMDTASYRTNADGYLLTRADMIWFWKHYLSSEADRANPYASPLRAKNLAGLAPALILTAEYDPLRDEGEAYGVRLRQAGVPVTCTRYDGAIHGFISLANVADIGKKGVEQVSAALRTAFGTA